MMRRYVDITIEKRGNDWLLVECPPAFLDLIGFSREEVQERFRDRFLAMLSSGDLVAADQFLSFPDAGYSLCPWSFTLTCAGEGHTLPVLLQTVGTETVPLRLRLHDARFLGDQTERMGRRIHALEQSFPCGLCQVLFDAHFTIIWINDIYLEMIGYTQAQFNQDIQCRGTGYVYPEDAAVVAQALERALAEGRQMFTLEMRIIRRDGAIRTLLTSFSFTDEVVGGIRVLYSCGVDITDSLLAQQSTLEAERLKIAMEAERLKIAMEQTSSFLLEYDVVQRTLLASDGLRRCLGAVGDIEDMPEGLLCAARVAPGSTDILQNIFRQIDAGKERVEGVFSLRQENGGDKWLRLRLISLFRESGWPVKALLLAEDITERYQIELRYREEEHRRVAMTYDMDFSAKFDLSTEKILSANQSKFPFFDFERSDSSREMIRRNADYYVHPDDRAEYLQKLDAGYMLRQFELGVPEITVDFQGKDAEGTYRWRRGVVHTILEPQRGNVCAYIYTKDINDEKEQELELRRHAEQDSLTGLFNRYTTEVLCDKLLGRKATDSLTAFFMVDLDNFKYLNDTFGHLKGDEMLHQAAESLGEVFPHGALLGRIGGDELMVLLEDCSSVAAAQEKAQALCDAIRLLAAGQGVVTASVGLAFAPRNGRTFAELYHCADGALYQAKSAGKNRWALYTGNDEAPKDQERLAVSRDWLLEESGDIVYVCDFYSYKLLYMNQGARVMFGVEDEEYLGKKCYEVLQGLDRPCDFCTNHMLCREQFYRWEFRNTTVDKTFLLRDRIVDWYGVPARIEFANDVSVIEQRNRILEEQVKLDSVIISCLRAITGTKCLALAADSVLRQLAEFHGADRAFILDYNAKDDLLSPWYQWCKSGLPSITDLVEDPFPPDERLRECLLRRENYIFDQGEGLDQGGSRYYTTFYNAGVTSQRCAPIYINRRPAGIIGLDNPTLFREDMTALETLGYFLSEELSRTKLSESLSFLSYHDSLTGLWNRNRYVEYVEELRLGRARSLGVAVADLNALKDINKLRGHAEGDAVVRRAANLLRQCFPGSEIYRLSGDEFVVHCENLDRLSFLELVSHVREQATDLRAHGISVGYAWTDREIDCAQLTMQATEIMLMQKRDFYRYQQETHASAKHDHARLQELMACLERGDYRMYLQPKADCAGFHLCGAEALARFYSPKEGLVSPNRFIPMLEEERTIQYLDLYIFEEVCKLLSRWQEEGRALLTISLNFSRQTVLEPNLLKTILEITDRYRVPKEFIEVEITETLGEYESSTIAEIGAGIKSAGFRLALDDFGSHYTNMAMLSAVPADVLKLDRSLVRDVMVSRSNQLVLKSILTLCKDLGIDSIAEGVESEEQFQLLRALHCDSIQGFLFGRPTTVEDFEQQYLG